MAELCFKVQLKFKPFTSPIPGTATFKLQIDEGGQLVGTVKVKYAGLASPDSFKTELTAIKDDFPE